MHFIKPHHFGRIKYMSEIAVAEDWQKISNDLESASPQEILRWALERFPLTLTMATAFGAEGCAVIDMLVKLADETNFFPDIFNLDTGYQFPQTLALRERIQNKYHIHIRLVSAKETVADLEKRNSGPMYKTDPDQCCYLRKVVPLRDAVADFDAFITSIRRDQTPERAKAPIVGMDEKMGIVKVNPLANWTKEQVWKYIDEHDVPVNPLHEQGFPSIGCWPCTKAVSAGDDDRAGRWAGREKRECGLHIPLQNKAGSGHVNF